MKGIMNAIADLIDDLVEGIANILGTRQIAVQPIPIEDDRVLRAKN